MPRPQSPDGPWVTVPVRLRQPDLDRVDAVRGPVTRSEWGRGAMLAALDGVPVRRERKARDRPRGPSRAAEVSAASLARERAEDARALEPCKHPKARVHKGLCGACGEHVGRGK